MMGRAAVVCTLALRPSDPRFYSVSDLAAMFSVSEDTIRAEIASGTIGAVRIRGCVRIAEDAVESYLRGVPVEPKAAETPISVRSAPPTTTEYRW
jgi:excisionase family DNA binding protein